MPADVESAFDVAFWFADTALNENEYLQPQKLQRLMYLAQAYYSASNPDRILMPAIFVADDLGPMEPNVYAAFSKGRPDIDASLFLAKDVEEFLMGIWRRFGHYTADRLAQLTKGSSAYVGARERGHRARIEHFEMVECFVRADSTPGVHQVVKPKMFRSQSGRPVRVQAWRPAKAPPDTQPLGANEKAKANQSKGPKKVTAANLGQALLDQGGVPSVDPGRPVDPQELVPVGAFKLLLDAGKQPRRKKPKAAAKPKKPAIPGKAVRTVVRTNEEGEQEEVVRTVSTDLPFRKITKS